MPLNNRLVNQPFDAWEGSGARWITKRELAMPAESTYKQMTVEHLGSDATEQDLQAFQQACERVLPTFDGDEQAATDYIWNNGDFATMLTEES